MAKTRGFFRICGEVLGEPIVSLCKEVGSIIGYPFAAAWYAVFGRKQEYRARPAREDDPITAPYIIAGTGSKRRKFILDADEGIPVIKVDGGQDATAQKSTITRKFLKFLVFFFAVSCGILTGYSLFALTAGLAAWLGYTVGSLVFYSTTRANYALTSDDAPNVILQVLRPNENLLHYTAADVNYFAEQYLKLNAEKVFYYDVLDHYIKQVKTNINIHGDSADGSLMDGADAQDDEGSQQWLDILKDALNKDIKRLTVFRFACDHGTKEWIAAHAEIRAKRAILAAISVPRPALAAAIKQLEIKNELDKQYIKDRLSLLQKKIKEKQRAADAFRVMREYNKVRGKDGSVIAAVYDRFSCAGDDAHGKGELVTEREALQQAQAKVSRESDEWLILQWKIEAKDEIIALVRNARMARTDSFRKLSSYAQSIHGAKKWAMGFSLLASIAAGVLSGFLSYGAVLGIPFLAAIPFFGWAVLAVNVIILGFFLFKGMADWIKHYDAADLKLMRDRYFSLKAISRAFTLRNMALALVYLIALVFAAYGLFALFTGASQLLNETLAQKAPFISAPLRAIITLVSLLLSLVSEAFFMGRTIIATIQGMITGDFSLSTWCQNKWAGVKSYFGSMSWQGKVAFAALACTGLLFVAMAINITVHLIRGIKNYFLVNGLGNGGPAALTVSRQGLPGFLHNLTTSHSGIIASAIFAGVACTCNSVAGMAEAIARNKEEDGFTVGGVHQHQQKSEEVTGGDDLGVVSLLHRSRGERGSGSELSDDGEAPQERYERVMGCQRSSSGISSHGNILEMVAGGDQGIPHEETLELKAQPGLPHIALSDRSVKGGSGAKYYHSVPAGDDADLRLTRLCDLSKRDFNANSFVDIAQAGLPYRLSAQKSGHVVETPIMGGDQGDEQMGQHTHTHYGFFHQSVVKLHGAGDMSPHTVLAC